MNMNNTVFLTDRKDKMALEHYDFLWEVMEENLNGVNSKKRLSVVLTPPPPPLINLCFKTIHKYRVMNIVLAPFRKPKTYRSVNTDGADSENETLSALFFDNAVLTDGLVNESASCQSLLTHAIASDVKVGINLSVKQRMMDDTRLFKWQKTINDI